MDERRVAAGSRRRASAPYVWIVGPDGCGKSTVAAAVAERTSALRLYWRPGLLPMAGRWLGRTPAPGVNDAPHAVSANRPLTAALRVGYYALDYVLGYWLVVLPARRRGHPVVIERGWWDMVVDARRYGLPDGRLARVLSPLIRKPHLVVVLSAPPSVIRLRKPELPEEEIGRQLDEWRAVSWRRTTLVAVDADRPVETVVREVVDLVEDRAGTP